MSAAGHAGQDRAIGLNVPVIKGTPWHVTSVKALPDYRLEVSFRDGVHGEVRMRDLVFSSRAGVFSALRDPKAFEHVFMSYGAVAWENGLDLAPDAMHAKIKADGVWALD
jgi:hypothetical protein